MKRAAIALALSFPPLLVALLLAIAEPSASQPLAPGAPAACTTPRYDLTFRTVTYHLVVLNTTWVRVGERMGSGAFVAACTDTVACLVANGCRPLGRPLKPLTSWVYRVLRFPPRVALSAEGHSRRLYLATDRCGRWIRRGVAATIVNEAGLIRCLGAVGVPTGSR